MVYVPEKVTTITNEGQYVLKYIEPSESADKLDKEKEPYLGTEGFEQRIAPDRWKNWPYRMSPDYSDGGVREYGLKLGCAFLGAAVVPARNFVLPAPLFRGGFIMLPFAVGGYMFGSLAWYTFQKRTAEKDAQLRYYMSTHEDQFHIESRKIKDTYWNWRPVRTM